MEIVGQSFRHGCIRNYGNGCVGHAEQRRGDRQWVRREVRSERGNSHSKYRRFVQQVSSAVSNVMNEAAFCASPTDERRFARAGAKRRFTTQMVDALLAHEVEPFAKWTDFAPNFDLALERQRTDRPYREGRAGHIIS